MKYSESGVQTGLLVFADSKETVSFSTVEEQGTD